MSLKNGKVLVTDGYCYGLTSPTQTAEISTEIVDPITRSWIWGGSMNQRRVRHSVSLLPDGNDLIASGDFHFDVHSQTSEIYYVSSGF